MRIATIIAGILLASLTSWAGLVEDYTSYPGEQQGTEVTVKVDGKSVFVHRHDPGPYSYVHFSFTGSAQIVVTGVSVTTVKPRAFAIPTTLNGNTLTFTIDKPFNYVISRDNGGGNNILLAIFAEAPLTNVPGTSDAGVHTAKSYGIDSTGATKETQKINDAITAISTAGGGALFFGRGIYTTGTIVMKNNVQLWLDAGALIKGSTSIADYPTVNDQSWGNGTLVWWNNVRNAKIRGHGIIDAQGSGNSWWSGRDMRHQLFFGAKNCAMEGVRIMNSTVWTIHPVNSDTLGFIGVRIMNKTPCCYVDQFDIDGCSYVTIDNCFTYGGDDGLCIKEVYRTQRPMTALTFRNTSVWSTSSNGLRAGANQSEGHWTICNNVLFDNVHFLHSGERSMRIQLCGAGTSDNWRFINCSTEGNDGNAIEMGNVAWNGACTTPPPPTSNFTWENLSIYGGSAINISIGTNNILKCIKVNGVVRTGAGYTPCSVVAAQTSAPAITTNSAKLRCGRHTLYAAGPNARWVTLLNMRGEVVLRAAIRDAQAIDITDLRAGVYSALIEDASGHVIKADAVLQSE